MVRPYNRPDYVQTGDVDAPRDMRRVLIVVLVLAACQFSEDLHLKRDVSRQELIGTWAATTFAIKSLGEVGVRDHLSADDQLMVLRADGSCSARMTFGLPGAAPYYRVYDSGCAWQLGRVGEQVLKLALAPRPGHGEPYFYFAEEHGKLILWSYIDDPDAWRYLEFERRTSSTSAPPTRVSVDTVRVGLMGAAFHVPTRCSVSCVADAPLEGGLSCWEPSDHQDMSGSYTLSDFRLLEPTASSVVGKRRVGPAIVYWGVSSDGSRFCAVASLPSRSDGGPSTWQFCTQSSDATVREYLRGIAESVEPDPGFTAPSPCGHSM